MNTFEKIKLMKSLLPNDEAAIRQAEKTMWDTFVSMRQQAGASDFIRALDGEPQQNKEKPSLLSLKLLLLQLQSPFSLGLYYSSKNFFFKLFSFCFMKIK